MESILREVDEIQRSLEEEDYLCKCFICEGWMDKENRVIRKSKLWTTTEISYKRDKGNKEIVTDTQDYCTGYIAICKDCNEKLKRGEIIN